MISIAKSIFSFKSNKVTIFRKLQFLFFALLLLSNFTIFNVKKIELTIFEIIKPISFFSNLLNKKIDNLHTKLALLEEVNRIEELKLENEKLKQDLADYNQSHNEALDIIKFRKNNFYFIDTIKVLSIIKNSEQYFICRYFSSSELSINDLILNQDNFLIGRVVSVNKDIKTAKVQLLQDENFLVPVYSGETKISGIVNNNRQLSSCQIEFSSLNTKSILNEDEIVLTSPEDGLLPADIKVGYISKKNNQYCIRTQTNIIKDKLFAVKNIFGFHKWD